MSGLFSFMRNGKIIACSALAASTGGIMIIRDWSQGGKYTKDNRVDGKVVIITGANTGIGKETVKELATRGAHVYMACRSMERCEAARTEIVLESKNKYVYCRECDLSSFDSIRKFVQNFKSERDRLDLLINNAGVMRCPKMLTKDGIEMQLGVNHMGHFLLTYLLLDYLKQSAPSRIVTVSSLAHLRGEINVTDLNSEQSYDTGKAYSQSKLANILFTKELTELLKNTGVTANSLHPGIVHTELGRHMSFFNSITAKIFVKPFLWPFMKTAKSGAQTTIYAAIDPDLEKVSGAYFSDCKEKSVAAQANDDKMAKWLWAVSLKWTNAHENQNNNFTFVIDFDTLDFNVLDDKGQDIFEKPLEGLETNLNV